MRASYAGAGGLALALACLSLAAPATAADLRGAPPPPPIDEGWRPTAIERWTGLYVGATYGYVDGSTDVSGDSGNFSFDKSGGIGTLLAGYNFQMGRAVLGVEADIWGLGDVSGDAGSGPGSVSGELNWLSSVRGRAGYLVSPALLLYGTAGFAWADYDIRAAGVSGSETFTGYQVGGGAEYAFAQRWTLRLEYVYTDLGSERISHGGFENTYDPDFHAVRAGVALKF